MAALPPEHAERPAMRISARDAALQGSSLGLLPGRQSRHPARCVASPFAEWVTADEGAKANAATVGAMVGYPSRFVARRACHCGHRARCRRRPRLPRVSGTRRNVLRTDLFDCGDNGDESGSGTAAETRSSADAAAEESRSAARSTSVADTGHAGSLSCCPSSPHCSSALVRPFRAHFAASREARGRDARRCRTASSNSSATRCRLATCRRPRPH